MEYGIKPPRGAVKLIDARNTTGGWQVHCTNCGHQWPEEPWKSTRTDAEDHKRYHHCPIPTTTSAEESQS